MRNVCIAFDILSEDQPLLVGWTQSNDHVVFDVKIDFTWKTRWVKMDIGLLSHLNQNKLEYLVVKV